jgi:hypothetical protein
MKTVGALMLLVISVTEASAGCINPPATPSAVDGFRANPQAFVAPNSDTRGIEAFVRELTGTDASLAAKFVRVAQETPPRFRTAIAAGLAQAAIACSTIDQHEGNLIQEAVASLEDGQFQAAFAAVAGDLSTAATGAATSAATGSVGSVVIVNPNRSVRAATNPGGGHSPGLVQITSGVITTNGTNTPTTSATAASPVSATR